MKWSIVGHKLACLAMPIKFYSQVFMAIALDKNSEVMILCFALAPVENIEN